MTAAASARRSGTHREPRPPQAEEPAHRRARVGESLLSCFVGLSLPLFVAAARDWAWRWAPDQVNGSHIIVDRGSRARSHDACPLQAPHSVAPRLFRRHCRPQDEHQDALPRWYEFAAAHGGLSEMSLVHIDAHSDMAIPSDYARNAGTRMQPPFDRDSIRTSNDEFIEESVQSHLVGRVTWIVPAWGVENEAGMFGREWEDGCVCPTEGLGLAGLAEERLNRARSCAAVLLLGTEALERRQNWLRARWHAG